MLTPEKIIELLKLEPLPVEGGWYFQSYISDEVIPARGLPERYSSPREFGSAIYYMLTSEQDSFAAIHCLSSDELYHFYLGDPVELLLLLPDGETCRLVLGQDILNGQSVQVLVPKGVWQGARLLPGGSFALMGTTMAPGWNEEDFIIGSREELIGQYPEEAEAIARLTRPEAAGVGVWGRSDGKDPRPA